MLTPCAKLFMRLAGAAGFVLLLAAEQKVCSWYTPRVNPPADSPDAANDPSQPRRRKPQTLTFESTLPDAAPPRWEKGLAVRPQMTDQARSESSGAGRDHPERLCDSSPAAALPWSGLPPCPQAIKSCLVGPSRNAACAVLLCCISPTGPPAA